jgi:hypothetical protein
LLISAISPPWFARASTASISLDRNRQVEVHVLDATHTQPGRELLSPNLVLPAGGVRYSAVWMVGVRVRSDRSQ